MRSQLDLNRALIIWETEGCERLAQKIRSSDFSVRHLRRLTSKIFVFKTNNEKVSERPKFLVLARNSN